MKKDRTSAIFIIIGFVLFVATLLSTDKYLSDQVWDDAEKFNEAIVDGVCVSAERQNLLVERSARSFLMNWFSYPDSGYVDFNNSPLTIRDRDIERFTRDIPKRLTGFLKANDSRFESCHFIIAPGNIKGYDDDYFTLYVDIDGECSYEAGFDISSDRTVAGLMTLSCDKWIIPDGNSPLKDYFSLSYYLPLHREDGSTFGAFGINVSVEALKKLLQKYLPYLGGNSEIRVEDLEGNVICSSESYAGGSEYHTFRRTLKDAPFNIVIVCSDKEIYKEFTHTANVITLVAIVGLVLIIVCTSLTLRRVLRRESERIAAESEIRLAAQVQKQLLRTPSEVSERYFTLKAWIKPALETGGDLYDFVVKEDKVLFIVGDVSGKGMSAAMFMTQVCSLFRSYSCLTDDPSGIVSHINSILSEGNASMTFCTLVAGSLDSDGHLVLCNAGHNPPVLVRGGVPDFLSLKHGIPVAIDDGMEYENDVIGLNDGDTLLLYTDGVTEARNHSHEMFGNDRLIDTVRRCGSESPDMLVDELHRFVGVEPQSDDITLLSCTYKSHD